MKHNTITLIELLTIYAKHKDDDFTVFLEDISCELDIELEIDELHNELDEGYATIIRNKKEVVDFLKKYLAAKEEEKRRFEQALAEDTDDLDSNQDPKIEDDIER